MPCFALRRDSYGIYKSGYRKQGKGNARSLAARKRGQGAAAVLALSLYLELMDIPNDKIDSFKAGELSVSLRDSTKTGCAQSLRMRAESMLSAYLDCGGFEFKGVVG